MLHNLAAVAANYRRAGIRLFVLAYFVRSPGEVRAVRQALGLPLRVARLTVGLPEIEQRLAGDVTSGRRDDLAEAAASSAAGQGGGAVVVRRRVVPAANGPANALDLPASARTRRGGPGCRSTGRSVVAAVRSAARTGLHVRSKRRCPASPAQAGAQARVARPPPGQVLL